MIVVWCNKLIYYVCKIKYHISNFFRDCLKRFNTLRVLTQRANNNTAAKSGKRRNSIKTSYTNQFNNNQISCKKKL